MTFLYRPLNVLVGKYRAIPFESWAVQFESRDTFNDYSEDDSSEKWWQAHTDVLEISKENGGRWYALVAITIYPWGVHASPPAPSAGLKVYEDGIVEGSWADGGEFTWRQHVG